MGFLDKVLRRGTQVTGAQANGQAAAPPPTAEGAGAAAQAPAAPVKRARIPVENHPKVQDAAGKYRSSLMTLVEAKETHARLGLVKSEDLVIAAKEGFAASHDLLVASIKLARADAGSFDLEADINRDIDICYAWANMQDARNTLGEAEPLFADQPEELAKFRAFYDDRKKAFAAAVAGADSFEAAEA